LSSLSNRDQDTKDGPDLNGFVFLGKIIKPCRGRFGHVETSITQVVLLVGMGNGDYRQFDARPWMRQTMGEARRLSAPGIRMLGIDNYIHTRAL
jgi:hypothetical protein